MTECEHYQELISRMLDDDLSKAERSALAAHVKSCPDCAAVYVAFRSVSEHLASELEEVPVSVHENIMAEVRRDSIRAKNSVHRSHRAWHTVLTVAACLVLVVAASLSLPKIVSPRAGSDSATQQAALLESPAEAAMEEPAAAPEEKAAPESNLMLSGALHDSAVSTEEESLAEAAEQASAAREPQYNDEGLLILNEEQSSTLLASLSGESVFLDAQPEQVIRVVVQDGDSSAPLTLLIGGGDALYVRADGDNTCRINLSPDELLALLGLAE